MFHQNREEADYGTTGAQAPSQGADFKAERAQIEGAIVESLIARRTARNEALMSSPEYLATVRSFALSMAKVMIAKMPDGEAIGKELDARSDELEVELCKQIMDPGTIRSAAERSARQFYQGAEALESAVQGMQAKLLAEGIEAPQLIEALRGFHSEVNSEQALNDRIVQELANVAEAHGLDEALTDAAYAEAVRKVFPTAEAFIEHYVSMTARLEPLVARVSAACDKEIPELGPVLSATLASYASEKGPLDEMRAMAFQREASEIYGN